VTDHATEAQQDQRSRELAVLQNLREKLARARGLHVEDATFGTCVECLHHWPCATEEALA
jgi:RNA polymerase-binding transcription factor DksA